VIDVLGESGSRNRLLRGSDCVIVGKVTRGGCKAFTRDAYSVSDRLDDVEYAGAAAAGDVHMECTGFERPFSDNALGSLSPSA
jgi:hypothetical protein